MKDDVLKEAFKLLNRRDYTEKQLFYKLQNKGFSDSDIKNVIDYLRSKNFIDDKRFAENYVFFRIKSGYGKRRIKFELIEKGISEEIAESVLDKESERAEEYFLKKLQQIKGRKNMIKKIFDAMYRRGFDRDTIFDLLNKYNVREKNEDI